MILLVLVFESARVSGVYIFPEESQINSYSEISWDQGSGYIRLPQKLLSQDRCKYRYESLLIIVTFTDFFTQHVFFFKFIL